MKTYEYEAIDRSGNSYSGTVQADSGEEAIYKLLQQRIFPRSIQTLSPSRLAITNRIDWLKRLREKLEAPTPTQPAKSTPTPIQARKIDWFYIAFILMALVLGATLLLV